MLFMSACGVRFFEHQAHIVQVALVNRGRCSNVSPERPGKVGQVAVSHGETDIRYGSTRVLEQADGFLHAPPDHVFLEIHVVGFFKAAAELPDIHMAGFRCVGLRDFLGQHPVDVFNRCVDSLAV